MTSVNAILNIAGYKFITLNELNALQASFQEKCNVLQLRGTILLSEEGININLAGIETAVNEFRDFLEADPRFHAMRFHETYSAVQPFQQLKVKLKKEIITLRQPTVKSTESRAPSLAPAELKQWLDEARDITLLDTRNDYEVRFGTFKGAVNLHMHHFGELPEAIHALDKNKPLVMFCTGGIRCEKAALHLMNEGFQEVYQLDGGILGYFAKVGAAHYDGECFVFDERVAVDAQLQASSTQQCTLCQGPITLSDQHSLTCAPRASCPACLSSPDLA